MISQNDNWNANLASPFTASGAIAFLHGSMDAVLGITVNYTV